MNDTTLVVKRGRGRPPGSKNKVKNVVQNPTEPVIKRGRGRPRKNTLQNIATESPGVNTVTPVGLVKRGRGRPKGSRNGVKTANSSSEAVKGYFKRIGKVVSHGACTGMTLIHFENVPMESQIQNFTEIGIRVLVAKYPDFYKIYFKRFFVTGDENHRQDAVEVYNANEERCECHYADQVALHPEGGSRRMIVLTDEDGNETGESVAAPVAITKSDERNERKVLKRAKKLAKENKKVIKAEIKKAKVEIKEIRAKMKKTKKVSDKKDLRQRIKQLKSLIGNKKIELQECLNKINGKDE